MSVESSIQATVEANCDGIVGPTHNYAGLSYGNVASSSNEGNASSPRAAALQGLEKAAFVASLGVPQAYLPPQERPHVPTLRKLGFCGSDAAIIERVAREDPMLLARVSSASAMWTANAATIAPSIDSADGRVQVTPANLRSMFHRSIEPPATARVLRAMFADETRFRHHDPLPSTELFGDEGAANHTRLRGRDGRGVHLFVYGKSEREDAPKRFPARQTLAASQAIARLHRLDPSRVVFAQQRPDAIDAGVFHNDVISVGGGRVLVLHELAFAEQERTLQKLAELVPDFHPVTIRAAELSLEEAVRTYLFNSQLLELPSGEMIVIAPVESEESPTARSALNRIVSDPGNPITAVHFRNLRESMRNGGGPACLRLRLQLTDREIQSANPSIWYEPARHARVEEWVRRHYRATLCARDLADPKLLEEGRTALDELTRILGLGSIYDFQRA